MLLCVSAHRPPQFNVLSPGREDLSPIPLHTLPAALGGTGWATHACKWRRGWATGWGLTSERGERGATRPLFERWPPAALKAWLSPVGARPRLQRTARRARGSRDRIEPADSSAVAARALLPTACVQRSARARFLRMRRQKSQLPPHRSLCVRAGERALVHAIFWIPGNLVQEGGKDRAGRQSNRSTA